MQARERRESPTATLVWGRALLLGTMMMLAGSVSHVLAGGLLPHPALMALMLALFTVLATRFLTGPASARRIVALVVAGQGLAHTALSLAAGHRGDSLAPAPAVPPTRRCSWASTAGATGSARCWMPGRSSRLMPRTPSRRLSLSRRSSTCGPT